MYRSIVPSLALSENGGSNGTAKRIQISRALNAAKRGSRKDVEFLADNWVHIPQSHFLSALHAFCSFLREPQQDSNVEYPPFEDVRTSYAVLSAIVKLVWDDTTRGMFLHQWGAALVKSWPGIKHWILQIGALELSEKHALGSEGRKRHSGLEESICIPIGGMLSYAVADLSKLILRDVDVFKLVSAIWFQQDAFLDYGRSRDPQELLDLNGPASSMILSHFFSTKAKEVNQSRFFDFGEGNVNLIALSIVQRVRDALRVGPRGAYDLVIYASLMYDMVVNDCPDVIDALCDNKGVHIMTKLLRKVPRFASLQTDKTIFPKQRENEDIAMMKAMGFLERAVSNAKSPKNMRQSIYSGLLAGLMDVFLFCSTRSVKDGASYFISLIVSCQLVTRDVVEEMAKSFCKLQQIMPDYVSKRYSLEWHGLESLVIERFICNRLLQCRKTTLRCICSSCGKVHASILKACALCRHGRYCSKECQLKEWNMHKRECRIMQEKRRNMKPSDESFVAAIVTTDVRHCWPGLLEMASQKFPGASIKQLAFTAAYESSLNPTFDVELLSDVPVEHGGEGRYPEMVLLKATHLYGGQGFSMCMDVNIERMGLPWPAGAGRLKYGISRTEKMVKESNARLETVEWDEVDEVWYRAVRFGNGNVWDSINSAIMYMESEGDPILRASFV